ncbi:MAG: glycosyltransferase family 2 protein [Candidatus Omnitrophota bacterium]
MIKQSISVVLPTFNEEGNIKIALGNIYNFLKRNFLDFEIIVVDDGSKDNSWQVCSGMKSALGDTLRITRHQENRGYGAALRTGLFSAEKDLVFYTDSDNQFDITQILEFIECIGEYDLVIGYRQARKDSFLRIFASGAYRKLVHFIFGLKVKDINCSFKLFKRSCLFQLSIDRDGFFVDTELLIKAKNSGFKIKELPVRHFSRKLGKSTVKVSHVFTTLKDIFYLHNKLKNEDA